MSYLFRNQSSNCAVYHRLSLGNMTSVYSKSIFPVKLDNAVPIRTVVHDCLSASLLTSIPLFAANIGHAFLFERLECENKNVLPWT